MTFRHDYPYDAADAERIAARMKSYTGPAVLVFFLYWLLWLPGLIVNWIYMQEARRMERIAGQSLPGVGCLTIMFWLAVALTGLSILTGCAFLFISLIAAAI